MDPTYTTPRDAADPDDPQDLTRIEHTIRAGLPIPAAKLNLRPSFKTDLLLDPGLLASVLAALKWFVLAYQNRLVLLDYHLDGAEPAGVLGLL